MRQLNTEEEIARRQQYLKMVERERERTEEKKESPANPVPAIQDPFELDEKGKGGVKVAPGMLDMFGSESPVVESAQVNTVPAAETCDDQDGYYKATIGEVIRNYRVTEILGKGVFGSVVRAVSVDTEEEVAIKIVRVDAVYRMSGETERSILKYLNDNDPRSK